MLAREMWVSDLFELYMYMFCILMSWWVLFLEIRLIVSKQCYEKRDGELFYIKRVLRGIKTKWHNGILNQILVGKKQLWKTLGRQLGQSEHEVRIRGYQGLMVIVWGMIISWAGKRVPRFLGAACWEVEGCSSWVGKTYLKRFCKVYVWSMQSANSY